MKSRTQFFVSLAMGAVLVPIAAQLGCGMFSSDEPTTTMTASNDVPAAEGTVQASAGPNGNTELVVEVKHLARPSMIAAGTTVYVVWIQPSNAPIQSVGALTLSEDLAGRLRAITPHRHFTLTITPESSAVVGRPSHAAVFTSAVDRTD
jgi:hypothetical protein